MGPLEAILLDGCGYLIATLFQLGILLCTVVITGVDAVMYEAPRLLPILNCDVPSSPRFPISEQCAGTTLRCNLRTVDIGVSVATYGCPNIIEYRLGLHDSIFVVHAGSRGIFWQATMIEPNDRADADPQTLSLQPSSSSHSSTAVIPISVAGGAATSRLRPSGPLHPYWTHCSIPVAMAANSTEVDSSAAILRTAICENGINIVLWARVGRICHRATTRSRWRQ